MRVPLYIAPEILELETSKNEDEFYTPACDMWSVGVILFALLSGYSPFDDEDEGVLYRNIRNGIYHLEPGVWDFISDPAKSLVAALLETDPNRRLSAEQALAHEWLRSDDAVDSTASTMIDRETPRGDRSDVARAERLKQQAEFIRAVREEEALAFRQAKRVDGGASEEALFHIDE